MTETAATPADVAAERLAPVVAEVTQIRREMAALQAREARMFVEAESIAQEWADASPSQSEADLVHRSVAAELAAALRVSDRTVQRQLGDAERMVSRFTQTMLSLAAGRISLAHARVIVEAGERIVEPELVTEFENSVLDYAESESASRLRPVAKRRAQWFLNETIRERHAAAVRRRSVQVFDLDDDMAELRLTGPAVIVHGIHDRLTHMGREVSEADAAAIADARDTLRAAERAARQGAGGSVGAASGVDCSAGVDDPAAGDPGADERVADNQGAGTAAGTGTGTGDAVSDVDRARADLDALLDARRSLDEIRADLLADMLLATDPAAHAGTRETGLGAIRATVQVTVPVLTLLDSPVDDPFDAVTLTGHGPIAPDNARELAGHAPGWDRILTHPISGSVLAVDRYQPSKKMRRFLAVRDQHCRFPGCRQPASRSDADHTTDWAHGGVTSVSNLTHLCRRHHTLKHHTPWRVVQKQGGVLEWTSPGGKVYPDHPVSGVHFSTDPEFDPPPPF